MENYPPQDLKDDWEKFHVKCSEFEEKWNMAMSGNEKYHRMQDDPLVREAFMRLGSVLDSLNFL